MNIRVIVTARMTSTRFPGKALALLAGKPVLWHVLRRCKMSGFPVALAIPDTPENDGLAVWAQGQVGTIVRGPEEDVLARFTLACDVTRPDIAVRVTGDCPMVDPALIVRVAGMVNSRRKVHPAGERVVAYATNTVRRTFPRGLDVEAMDTGLVVLAHREATDPSDREHVTPWMQRTSAAGGYDAHLSQENYTEAAWRWCVDTAGDLAWLNRMAVAYRPDGRMLPQAGWLRDYLRQHPEEVRLDFAQDIPIRDAI